MNAERENRVPPLMTLTEFRAAARACGVLPSEDARAMDLLLQLGTVVYYNDPNVCDSFIIFILYSFFYSLIL